MAGELDSLLSSVPHAHLITCPVFGAPRVADKAQLLLIMSGEYHFKKEVAHLLVPAVGRKVIDLGENLEKGRYYCGLFWNYKVSVIGSPYFQAHRQLYDSWHPRNTCREFYLGFQIWDSHQGRKPTCQGCVSILGFYTKID